MSSSQLQTMPVASSRASVSPQLACRVAIVFAVLGLFAPSMWVAKLALGFVLIPLWAVLDQAWGQQAKATEAVSDPETVRSEESLDVCAQPEASETFESVSCSPVEDVQKSGDDLELELPSCDVESGQEKPREPHSEIETEGEPLSSSEIQSSWQSAIWEQSSLPLCLVDAEGNLQKHNLAAELAADIQESQGDTLRDPWCKLFPDATDRAALLDLVVRQGVRHQEIRQTPWGRAQVSLSPMIDADGAGRGLVLSWVPCLGQADALSAMMLGLEAFKAQVAELGGAQDLWWQQSEQTRQLLEQAWMGLDSEPLDRQGWAEGSSQWKGMTAECARLASSLEGLLAESCGSVESLQNELKVCGEAAEVLSQCVPSLLKFSDQAKLLAFNGTIEAVGAGDAGIGFGRVATEVRDLAYDGHRKGQSALGQLERWELALAELQTDGASLWNLVQKVHATALDLIKHLAEQETHAKHMVKVGCRQNETTSDLARTLQVVVEASRVHGAMARNFGQNLKGLERPLDEWIDRLSKTLSEEEEPASELVDRLESEGRDPGLRIVA